MTLEDKYTAIGESYVDVLLRLNKEERIDRFSKMFFTTGDFEELEKFVAAKDISNVFEYSHRIKGNSINIGFSIFSNKVNELVEFVRPREVSDYDKLNELFEGIKSEYIRIKTIFDKK